MRQAVGMSWNRLLHLALAVACSVAGQPTSEARRPQFTDVAGRSRFDYISNNDLSPRKYFQQPMCGGGAILDYDHDGLMDIFFTNGAKELFHAVRELVRMLQSI